MPIVVVPPINAARVSVSDSSSNERSVLMWVCGSKMPGSAPGRKGN